MHFSPVGKKTALSPIDAIELAQMYDKITAEECYTKESFMAYLHIVENKLSQCRPELSSDCNPTTASPFTTITTTRG